MVYITSRETQERKDAKRHYILDTAAFIFAEKGYHNTNVKDIVDKANISVGSFYFYFKSKEELFKALYDEMTEKVHNYVENVLDYKNGGMVKNFTRAITASLWVYQSKRELAKILLIEAASINAEFEKKMSDNIKINCNRMEERLQSFKIKGLIQVPDTRIAALAFEGSLYYLIIDWLEKESNVKLTDSAFTLVIYNLQALAITFNVDEVKEYINEVLDELNNK